MQHAIHPTVNRDSKRRNVDSAVVGVFSKNESVMSGRSSKEIIRVNDETMFHF
jgi:hypothetical protein